MSVREPFSRENVTRPLCVSASVRARVCAGGVHVCA